MYVKLLRKKRRHVDTIERFYVYKETMNKNKLKFSDNTKNFTPRVWRYFSFNKQPDCNSKEENTQNGLRLRTKICFFWEKSGTQKVKVKLKIKMNVPYVEVKLCTSKAIYLIRLASFQFLYKYPCIIHTSIFILQIRYHKHRGPA
jgi:hypothetical protein